MSDMSEGPGWWIASDDKWYPPHLHPSVRVPDPSEVVVDHVTAEAPASVDSPSSELSTTSADSGGPGDPDDPGSVPDADRSPVETHPPKKRSRTPVAAGLSIVVIIMLIVGAIVLFGNSDSASAKVVSAVDSTLNNGTAHVTLNLSGTADGTSVTGTGSGSIDFANNALQLQMTVGADGQQVPINAIYLGGVIYETIPGLDTIAPGKSWLSIDLSSLQKAEQQDPSTQELGDNPTVMLQMLAQQGNSVVPLGPSTVDGVAVNGYSVTVNRAGIAQQLKKADLPSWMQESVSGLTVHNIGMKVYVDNAGLLRSFEMQLTETTGSSGPTTVDETLGFSDYGAPVNVTAPPAPQVESFQQLLQAAGTQGAATS